MNKGIVLATGDVLGILNADDFFASPNVISDVASAFAASDADIVYGDLDYVRANGAIARKWISGVYRHGMFNRGWMPPHPAFYCRRSLFNTLGAYNLQYGSAADFELMIRFIHLNKLKTQYIEKTLVKMTLGGVSNKSFLNRIKAWGNDIKAMRDNGIKFPLLAIICKPLRKIGQFI